MENQQFIVVRINADYDRLDERQDTLADAVRTFQQWSTQNDVSVVLYNSGDDQVIRFTIKSEPILLVTAITSARTIGRVVEIQGAHQNDYVIKLIADFIQNKRQPNNGINTVAPYFIVKNLVAGQVAAGIGAGFYGALAGGVGGFLLGGPVGAVAGAVIGGGGFGGGASQFVRILAPPNPCRACRGTGLVDNVERCVGCGGVGHK